MFCVFNEHNLIRRHQVQFRVHFIAAHSHRSKSVCIPQVTHNILNIVLSWLCFYFSVKNCKILFSFPLFSCFFVIFVLALHKKFKNSSHIQIRIFLFTCNHCLFPDVSLHWQLLLQTSCVGYSVYICQILKGHGFCQMKHF